jgi:hypothetical protein
VVQKLVCKVRCVFGGREGGNVGAKMDAQRTTKSNCREIRRGRYEVKACRSFEESEGFPRTGLLINKRSLSRKRARTGHF